MSNPLLRRLTNCCHSRAPAEGQVIHCPPPPPPSSPRSLAYFHLDEFESALDAFESARALEPAKRIHAQWADMCRVQLGGAVAVGCGAWGGWVAWP